MSFLWFCTCAYLLVSIVGLLEADIRVRPGASPSALQIVRSALLFALTHPADAALRWLLTRARG